MNRRDPRIRQTLDRLQTEFETANLNAQASIYTFSERYVNPCLQSFSSCLESSCYPCLGARRARARQRLMSRGTRPELSFDFYNDFWEDEVGGEEPTESTGLLDSHGSGEWDRLLAGNGSVGEQPPRPAQMNYGSRGPPSAGLPGRARSGTGPKGGEIDAQDYQGSSMFGFLESLPWKIGRRGLRYTPSAANLRDNPHRKGGDDVARDGEDEGLLQSSEDEAQPGPRRGLSAAIAGRGRSEAGVGGPSQARRHNRKRSSTVASRGTTNSLSSRGDLFASDDEDDAVPLDDEFTHALGRRVTADETATTASGKKSSKSSGTRSASQNTSGSKSTRSKRRKQAGAPDSGGDTTEGDDTSAGPTSPAPFGDSALPSSEDLRRDEVEAAADTEAETAEHRQPEEGQVRAVKQASDKPEGVERDEPAPVPTAASESPATATPPERADEDPQ